MRGQASGSETCCLRWFRWVGFGGGQPSRSRRLPPGAGRGSKLGIQHTYPTWQEAEGVGGGAAFSKQDVVDMVIDAVFMVDIVLSFLTAYEDQVARYNNDMI